VAPKPNPAYQEHKEKIKQVADRYHGFHVWVTRHGVPMATRTRATPPKSASAGWAATLMAERPGDWPDLETQLAEQAKIDQGLAERSHPELSA
jgi:hypothetical protein